MSESLQSAYQPDLPTLQSALQAWGEPGYRARQVCSWLYGRFALSFAEMTDLPAALRERLQERYALPGCRVVEQQESPDAAKLLLEFPDGERVECVSLNEEHSPTFCLSTQVGCALQCAFCATGQGDFERDLAAPEIITQATVLAARYGRPGNLVFMGMGEPLLNLGAVTQAAERFSDSAGMGLSRRRITVATVGLVPQIRELGRMGLGVNLAISLNATRDDRRRELMPGAARWTLQELLDAAREFSELTGGQPVTFAYVLIRKVNDFGADAERLVRMLRPLRHHLNLIPLNPVEHALLAPPDQRHVARFLHRLREAGLNVSVRWSKGADIGAACGQLRRRSR